MDGGRLFRYQFQVPPESSHYRIHAGGDWRITGYSGTVSIDPDSFKLRRLIVRTSELPEETGACEAATTVEYASVRIGTGDFPLPRHSDLHILLRDTAERETSTMYSACRQFVGEANLVAAPAKEAGEQPKLRRDPFPFRQASRF